MSVRGVFSYLQSTRSFKLPRDELENLQLKRLRVLLRYAYDNNKVWNESFKRVGLDPTQVSTLHDLSKLPSVTKTDMMLVQDAAREAGLLEGAKVIMSSGTTGQPSGFARGKRRGGSGRAMSYRTNMLHGLRPWSRVATLWAPQKYWKQEVSEDGSSRPYTGLYNNPLWPFRKVLRNLMTMWVNPMDPVGDGKLLADFKPEIIFGRPSYLRRIARYGGTGLKIRPRLIEAAGEILTPTGFKELRDAYDAKVVRQYGSSDVGKLGADCLHESGIHMWEDYRIYEVLKDGQPASPGEVGELVVTNLPLDAIPFIRYRTGDYVKLAEEGRCDCGSYMRRLSTIEGRTKDWVAGKEGEKVWSLDVADHLESEFGMRDFQLIQTGEFEFNLLLRSDDLERHQDLSDVKNYVEGLLGGPISLSVGARSDDDYWVKTRPVVCRIPG